MAGVRAGGRACLFERAHILFAPNAARLETSAQARRKVSSKQRVKRLVYNVNTKIIAMTISILFCILPRSASLPLHLSVGRLPCTPVHANKGVQFKFTIINPVCTPYKSLDITQSRAPISSDCVRVAFGVQHNAHAHTHTCEATFMS